MKYSTLKHKTVSQNIANADVPNYKSKDVSFRHILDDEQSKTIQAYRTNPRHIHFENQAAHSPIITKKNQQYHHNGNNVDIDKEMADLATNQIYYNALIERLNGKFSTLSNVIRGGR